MHACRSNATQLITTVDPPVAMSFSESACSSLSSALGVPLVFAVCLVSLVHFSSACFLVTPTADVDLGLAGVLDYPEANNMFGGSVTFAAAVNTSSWADVQVWWHRAGHLECPRGCSISTVSRSLNPHFDVFRMGWHVGASMHASVIRPCTYPSSRQAHPAYQTW